MMKDSRGKKEHSFDQHSAVSGQFMRASQSSTSQRKAEESKSGWNSTAGGTDHAFPSNWPTAARQRSREVGQLQVGAGLLRYEIGLGWRGIVSR